MLNSSKWMLFALSLGLLSNACGPQPPDVPVCEYLQPALLEDPVDHHLKWEPSPACMKAIGEPSCGHCVHIVSGKELFIGEDPKTHLNGKPWSDVMASSVLLPAKEAYAPMAAYVINACKKMKCNDEVPRYRTRLSSLKRAAKALDWEPVP